MTDPKEYAERMSELLGDLYKRAMSGDITEDDRYMIFFRIGQLMELARAIEEER